MKAFDTISSVQNGRVKNLVRLRESSHRRRQQRFLIEGQREIERAMGAHWPLESLYFCEDLFKSEAAFALLDRAVDRQLEVIRLSSGAFAKCAYRQGPDGLLATAIQQTRRLGDLALSPAPFLVVLEGVEKPGNVGAVLRTANAAGADALILANSVTDPFNPNAIRASQGALFDLPFASASNEELLLFLEEKGITPILTSPDAENLFWDLDLRGPVALFLGSEDDGLSADWLEAFPACRLPMRGVTDSLNVASMAAVALFETVRQRRSQSSA